MDKTTQLFIRACKAKNHYKRLKKLHRMFYLVIDKNVDIHLINILAKIVDTYIKPSVIETLDGIDYKTMFTDERNYHTRCLDFLTAQIRFSKVDNFPGLTSPKMFRT